MMKPLKAFIIQFAGIKLGEHCFEYEIDKKFFDFFEYEDFNDIDVSVNVVLNKKTTFLEFYFKAKGTINVNCDLTLHEVADQAQPHASERAADQGAGLGTKGAHRPGRRDPATPRHVRPCRRVEMVRRRPDNAALAAGPIGRIAGRRMAPATTGATEAGRAPEDRRQSRRQIRR